MTTVSIPVTYPSTCAGVGYAYLMFHTTAESNVLSFPCYAIVLATCPTVRLALQSNTSLSVHLYVHVRPHIIQYNSSTTYTIVTSTLRTHSTSFLLSYSLVYCAAGTLQESILWSLIRWQLLQLSFSCWPDLPPICRLWYNQSTEQHTSILCITSCSAVLLL